VARHGGAGQGEAWQGKATRVISRVKNEHQNGNGNTQEPDSVQPE
jgi:hypothetical protein